MLEQTAIPPRFIGKTFANYRTDSEGQERALRVCREYAGSFSRHLRTGGSLILSGQPGTGKSHLAGAVLQAILPQYVGAYVTLMDLIRGLRDTWRRDSEITENQFLSRLEAIPLLVIDEIGVQYGTDGERAILFDVLDRRYRNMRPAILMTNLSKDEFRVAIGDRVFDRLTEVARWVPFEWGSYRTQARKEMRDAS
jgi:DNA replication protein DnaC